MRKIVIFNFFDYGWTPTPIHGELVVYDAREHILAEDGTNCLGRAPSKFPKKFFYFRIGDFEYIFDLIVELGVMKNTALRTGLKIISEGRKVRNKESLKLRKFELKVKNLKIENKKRSENLQNLKQGILSDKFFDSAKRLV